VDLSFWLTTVSLAALIYAASTWLYGSYIAPARAARKAVQNGKSVKRKPRSLAFKPRSQRSERSNAVNAGSEHQEAKQEAFNVHSVQASAAAPAIPAGAPPGGGDNFTLTPRELVQLAEALTLYREGATIEQAVCKAFGVTKGAGEGWKRGKALFDAATMAPGAAPAGTYVAAPATRRRRAAAR
jgi:hypothetical protein